MSSEAFLLARNVGVLTEQPLPCIEGTRILTLEGCTVSVISVFPDNTAYVITRKTFPQAVIDAGRRKWKIQTHASHYGMNQEQWQSQYQGGFDYASQQQQAHYNYNAPPGMEDYLSQVRRAQAEGRDPFEELMRNIFGDDKHGL